MEDVVLHIDPYRVGAAIEAVRSGAGGACVKAEAVVADVHLVVIADKHAVAGGTGQCAVPGIVGHPVVTCGGVSGVVGVHAVVDGVEIKGVVQHVGVGVVEVGHVGVDRCEVADTLSYPVVVEVDGIGVVGVDGRVVHIAYLVVFDGHVVDASRRTGAIDIAAGAAAFKQVVVDADIPDGPLIEAYRTVVGAGDCRGEVLGHIQVAVPYLHILAAAGHHNAVAVVVAAGGVGCHAGQGEVPDNHMAGTVQHERCGKCCGLGLVCVIRPFPNH